MEAEILKEALELFRWCSDIFEIPCWNRDWVRVVFVMDCCDREVFSYLASIWGISGEMIRDLMVGSVWSLTCPIG